MKNIDGFTVSNFATTHVGKVRMETRITEHSVVNIVSTVNHGPGARPLRDMTPRRHMWSGSHTHQET